jgi:multidrug resistance efflux pump
METPQVIAALLEKRTDIRQSIAELERQVRKHKADMAQLDATIGLFAPNVVQAKREVSRFARSAHFVVGELTRRCQTALREANGEPVTADSIALQAMREKGLNVGDGELRADMARRILWTLNRMLSRGAVRKQGNGAGAEWALPPVVEQQLL